MSEDQGYFAKSESWAVDQQERDSRSRRIAWTVAGIAGAIALIEAVAIAAMMPLKSVAPVTVLVDRQTGFTTTVDPNSPRPIAANEALTQSLLAQYVTAREGFDRATVALDYRRVGLWSADSARSSYLAAMPASNPASPVNTHQPGTTVSVEVKSVSKIGDGAALVRFDATERDRAGQVRQSQPWISVVRYRFSDAPMSYADRLVNPLGFQVTSYRRDAEGTPTVVPQQSAPAGPVNPADQAAPVAGATTGAAR